MQGNVQQSAGRFEMTSSGWIVVLAILGGLGYGGYVAWQHNFTRLGRTTAESAESTLVTRPLVPDTPARTLSGAAGIPAAQSSTPSPAQLTDELLRERRDRAIQAAAWRAVADTTRQQIAAIDGSLQDLDARIAAIQKVPPTAVAEAAKHTNAARDDAAQAAASSKSLHQSLDTARAAAGVDISSLPVESDSAQALNVTGFGNGVVEMGGRSLTVGHEYQNGETVIAIDPGSHSIVTNRRIINITN